MSDAFTSVISRFESIPAESIPGSTKRQVYTPHVPLVIDPADEHRIRGIATLREVDRYGTIVEPRGMRPIRGVVPLLAFHKPDQIAGVVEEIDQQSDRIEITARITNEELWEDVVEGGLAGLSIGFLAHEMTDDDPPRITDWELMEVSLVSTPANVSAVVLTARGAMNDLVPAASDQRSGLTEAKVVDLPSTRVLREFPAATPAIQRFRNPRFHLSNVLAAALHHDRLTGFEAEVCRELEKRSDTDTRGIRVPASIFQRQSPHFGARQISTDPGSAAALSPQEWMQQLLDDVAAARRWGVLSNRLGFVIVSSLRETVHIPKRMTRIQAGWGQKDAVAAESNTTFDDDTLTPLYAKVTTTIRRSALRYTDPAVDAIVTRDIGEGLDDAIDEGILFGTGTNEQPTGLLTAPAFTVDKAGVLPIWQDFADLKGRMVETWRLDDVGSALRWAMNPIMYDRLRTISVKEVPTAAGEWFTGLVPANTGEGVVLSIAVMQSGRLAPRTTGAPPRQVTDIHLIYGAMGVICYFGNASVDLIVDPYSLSTQGAVRITGFVDVNCAARDDNIDVAIINGALATPPP